MSDANNQKRKGEAEAAERTARARRPYQKPAFTREQLFETMALACGKTSPSIGQCQGNRKNS